MASIQVESIQPIGSQANPTRLAAYHQQTQPEFFFFLLPGWEKEILLWLSFSIHWPLYLGPLVLMILWSIRRVMFNNSTICTWVKPKNTVFLLLPAMKPRNRADALSITMKWPLRIHGVVNELYFNLQKMKAQRPSFWLTDKRKPKSRLFSCYFLPY